MASESSLTTTIRGIHFGFLKRSQAPVTRPERYVPDVACLRRYGILQGTLIDRNCCEELLHDPCTPFDVQIAAAYTADSFRHVSIHYTAQYQPLDTAHVTGVVNHLLLENLHSRVQNLPFFAPLSSVKPTMDYILGKVIPQRCQGRKISAVLLQRTRFSPKELTQIASQDNGKMTPKQTAKQAEFPHTLFILRQLVLNSLLGYYPHSDPITRPDVSRRMMLYKLFEDTVWFDALLGGEGVVIVEYALRDYLIYAIPDNQGMFNTIKKQFDFTAWSEITQTFLNKVRPLFERQLGFVVTLRKLITTCHVATLDVSYRRVNNSVGEQCISSLKQIPFVTRPGFQVENQFEEPPDLILEGEVAPKIEEAPLVVTSLSAFISDAHYQLLTHCMRRVNPRRLGCIQRVLSVLDEGVGLSSAIRKLLIVLCNAHQQPGTNPQRFREHLHILATRQPHAYNILQTLAAIQAELLQIRVVEDLPVSYTTYQIAAIQESYGLAATDLLQSNLYFTYCPYCFTIYSNIRDPHPVFKASYDEGYRDCVVDLHTNEIYCRRDKTNHRGTCGVKPLEQIFLLGRTLRYGNKVLFLCPQVGCGKIMSFDPSVAAHTARGWACCKCSQVVAQVSKEKYACTLCGVDEIKDGYHYPHGVVLCKKHHLGVKWMDRDILRGSTNKAQVVSVMRKYKKEMKDNATAKAAAYSKG